MTAPLIAALLDGLDDEALDQLAERLAPRLEPLIGRRGESVWLTVPQAAEYLGCPRSRIYALTSAAQIPFHKDGSRNLYRRDELDRWIERGGGRRP